MEIIKYRCELNENKHPVLVVDRVDEYVSDIITEPKHAAEMISKIYKIDCMAEEYVYMIALNCKGKVVGVFEISHGGVDFACASPREILIRALLVGAVFMLLVHNHPSGDVTPSKNDIDICNAIKKAGELVRIKLHDSIILGENGSYYSFRENIEE